MTFLKFGFVALTALTLAACSDSDEDMTAQPYDPNASSISESSLQYFNTVVGDRVLFATDSSSVDSYAQETLTRQAEWLNQNPSVTATIEGHADERGTREYNLALGARRANAAYNFLVSRGVSASRLRTVSYGKERPEATCSNESCWSQNRRAVTVIAGAPMS
ncbi:peptidoglycan-associated lipoprotein Pal [Paroceanicella profunda]|uniref:Peptidoglycan-associated lipoprotein n=1 Tax=Paroceanicella profunda TaxID=2579971 RepID=A0A5B8FH69_9RHOB|nr:peptidoglycan-associated lipoprotein Pal [Paroceanicella profunda]QDL92071.1 peptidoglycan-associated lipoprotein Pal [Paroceanicella profunda]